MLTIVEVIGTSTHMLSFALAHSFSLTYFGGTLARLRYGCYCCCCGGGAR
jgi:hypothetical protein